MDAMKDALKRKMQDAKMGAAPKGPMAMMGEDPEEQAVKSGEVAPSLDSEGPGEMMADPGESMEMGEGGDAPLLAAAKDAVGDDMMNKILMAIADSGSSNPSNSIGGRAAMGAQAKMASLKGPMK